MSKYLAGSELSEDFDTLPPSTQPVVGGRPTDVQVVGVSLYFLPIETRVPLKFGAETLTSVTCARVCVRVRDREGRTAEGWGETPLNVQWVWPSPTPYRDRYDVTLKFCERLARRWASFDRFGHPLEIGHSFQESALAEEMASARGAEPAKRQIPLLAALLCCAPFDIALYDAYGNLHGIPALAALNETYCSSDLSCFLQPATDSEVAFGGKYPADYMVYPPAKSLAAWHLVGGLDPLSMDELTGDEPDDGHPVLLSDW
ncbi:MAG: hypothetical protein AAGF31_13765, partial [Planctomycetota bacterium]